MGETVKHRRVDGRNQLHADKRRQRCQRQEHNRRRQTGQRKLAKNQIGADFDRIDDGEEMIAVPASSFGSSRSGSIYMWNGGPPTLQINLVNPDTAPKSTPLR